MSLSCAQRVVPLERLDAGKSGRVVEIDGNVQAVVRLAEMGITSGTNIRMLRPGRPCIIAIGNQRMSFRGENTGLIMVETA